MQISQRGTVRAKKSKKEDITPEEFLRRAELMLECSRFELERIKQLMKRKKFVRSIQKDTAKLERMMDRQRRVEKQVDQYNELVLDVKLEMSKTKEASENKT